jgi:biopolymer transport protein ExbD
MIGTTFLYQKKKSPFAAKLNLVALMDIFTILVFFLLLNSGESQNIENARFVELPKSTTGTAAHKELIVSIGKDDIWLDGEAIAKNANVVANIDAPIEKLVEALNRYTETKGELTPFEKQNGLSITIMGDKYVPYGLLKSVMATCRLQNYRNISLAVNQTVTGNLPDASVSSVAPNLNAAGG